MESKEDHVGVTFPASDEEVYLPRGGTDPDFYIPAEWQHRERSWKRLVQRFVWRRRPRLT